MHVERSDCPCPALAPETERCVLMILLASGHSPWSRTELQRELSGTRGTRVDVDAALDELYGAGLVHVQDEFVYPSRAARAMDELGL
jgi:hypothetical protein